MTFGTRDEDYRFALHKATIEGVEMMVRYLTLKQALEARDMPVRNPHIPPSQIPLAYYFVTDLKAPHKGELTWADLPTESQAGGAVSHDKPSRARARASEAVGEVL